MPRQTCRELSSNSGGSYSTVAAAVTDAGAYNFVTTSLTDGALFRVRVTPTDSVGNAGAASASGSDFVVDNTNPVLSLTSRPDKV